MKAILIAAGSTALLASALVTADDHDDYILDITQIAVKMGHNMQFRDGVKAYMACYAEAGGENGWSTWRNVDGEGIVYHVVSQMDSWADLDDSDDEAASGCASVVRDEIQPHMASLNSIFA